MRCIRCGRIKAVNQMGHKLYYCSHCRIQFDGEDDGDITYGDPSKRMQREENREENRQKRRRARTTSCVVACIAFSWIVAITHYSGAEPNPEGDAGSRRNNLPPLGVTARAVIDRVIDGDTVDVTLTQRVRIRLIDCWAPETKGHNKLEGERSRRHLQRLLPQGADVVVHIPTQSATEVADVFTFGRVVGRIWPEGTDTSAGETMVNDGFATRQKEAKR